MKNFIFKNWKIVLIILLIITLYITINKAITNKQKYEREKSNVESLLTDIEHSKTKHGEDVTTIKELQLTVDEFKKLRNEDLQLIKELKIKANEVKEVVKTVTETRIEYRDTLVKISPNNFLWNKETRWWKVNQKIDFGVTPPVIDFKMQNKDSLTHVLYKIPKFKFLWMHFGTKGYEIKVISHNPNSTILYNQWINVSKDNKKRKRE